FKISTAGVNGRKPRHVRFDGEPRLDQLQRTDKRGDVVEAVVFRPRIIDERAAAGAARHEVHLFKLFEDLANSGTRRTEGHVQLPLGGQLVAGSVDSGLDRVLEPAQYEVGRTAGSQ